jgi:hypothetical protein
MHHTRRWKVLDTAKVARNNTEALCNRVIVEENIPSSMNGP